MTPPFRKVVLDETDSTNSEARRRAEAGAPDGLAVVARRQTAGRGRRGRRWESPEGNLYVSLLLRPDRPLAEAALLSFVAAVALGEAVAAMLPPEAPIAFKWPNDLLVGGAKCAGMLLESSAAGAGRLDWLIVGVGVNLASHPEGLPYPATDLAAAGAPAPTPGAALEAFLGRFAHWRDIWSRRGFAPVRRAWLARAAGLGGPVEVRAGNATLCGTFAGLDPEGAMLLESARGRRRVTAGDVFFPAAA